MNRKPKAPIKIKTPFSVFSTRVVANRTKLIDSFWKDDYGFVWLLAITIFFIFTSQFSFGPIWAERFLIRLGFFLFSIIAIASSVLSLSAKRTGYIVAVFLLLVGIFLIFQPEKFFLLTYGIIVTFFLFFIWTIVIKQIFVGEKVSIRKIGGGIAAYLLLGHIWANLYVTIYVFNPSIFLAGGNLIPPEKAVQDLSYFSFVTLTTVGYGDVLALGPLGRTLVIFEGLIGQLFPVVLIARLVSLHIEETRKS